MSETKRAMTGHIPAPGRPLVVEISLKTAEGDSLVLEWWRLAVVAGGDPMVRSFISRYKFILLFYFLLIILL
jgi:autophagy-related protein 13